MSPDFTPWTTAVVVLFTACGNSGSPVIPAAPTDSPLSTVPVALPTPIDPPGGATVAPVSSDPPPAAPAIPTPSPEDPVLALLRSPPEGFVDLRKTLDGACFHIGYHRADNFTGAPLPGYGAPGAWMLEAPAKALSTVQTDVRAAGYTLIIYDSYRPYRGTQAMVAWATRTNQVFLLDNGYIARRSRHNHGDTVDLGLANPDTCEPIDMGTPWDTLDERSHTMNATGDALKRRLLLKAAMSKQGFQPYSREWWHFQFPTTGTIGRDVPYGCMEPDEKAFVPPAGWDQPGWIAPAEPPSGPCP